jgi:hypothetical protein
VTAPPRDAATEQDAKLLELAVNAHASATAQLEATRQRAHQTATLAAAVVAALITAGALRVFDQRPAWVLLLGLVALVLWVASFALYLYAVVGASRHSVLQPGRRASQLDYYHALINEEQTQYQIVAGRLRHAVVFTGVALVTSGAAVVAGLATEAQVGRIDATVTLSESGRAAVDAGCDRAVPAAVQASVVTDTLNDPYITFRLGAGVCDSDARDVRVLRDGVVAVRANYRAPDAAARAP